MAESVPEPENDPFRLYPRTYVWVVLGLASLLMAMLAASLQPGKRAAKTPGTSLTASEFADLTQAESAARVAIGLSLLEKAVPSAPDSGSEFRRAIAAYRKLLPVRGLVNVPRRLIILQHLEGKPLQEQLLQEQLVPDLKLLGTSPAEIQAELALWRGLYGQGKKPAVAESEARIRAMRLRSMERQALYDLYRVSAPERAPEALRKRNTAALGALTITGVGVLTAFVALCIGLVCLVIFLNGVYRRNLLTIGLLASPPSPLRYADLIDSFAFYFFALESSRILFSLIGLAFPSFVSDDLQNGLWGRVLELIRYIFPHLIAMVYAARLFHRHGVTFADIGWTGWRNLMGHLGFGVMGYCASIPLLIPLGWLSDLISEFAPNATPNPGITMLVSETSPVGRILLFLMIAVLAPIFEEFFFRGLLLTGLRKRWPAAGAIALSALLFAVLHPFQDWPTILGLGVVFGTLRLMRKSLVPSMLAHFLQNGVTYLLLTTLFSG